MMRSAPQQKRDVSRCTLSDAQELPNELIVRIANPAPLRLQVLESYDAHYLWSSRRPMRHNGDDNGHAPTIRPAAPRRALSASACGNPGKRVRFDERQSTYEPDSFGPLSLRESFRRDLPTRPKQAGGSGYGLAIWAASYLGWIPAAGILTPATKHRASRNLLMLAAHVVWGTALAAGVRELEFSRNDIFTRGPARDVLARQSPDREVGVRRS